MGAAAVGAQGVMQQDSILVAAERRFIDRAEQVILLVDSTKLRPERIDQISPRPPQELSASVKKLRLRPPTRRLLIPRTHPAWMLGLQLGSGNGYAQVLADSRA
jgi:hypothetical protein